MTQTELAVERVLERAGRHDRKRLAEHTLIMGGSAGDQRGVLDQIEAGLIHSPTALRFGRLREPHEHATDAAGLWNDIAIAAKLDENEHVHTSGLGRIQQAAGNCLFVAIVDDLDHVLRNWEDPGEALNLRWALQNVNGLMVVAASEGPISTADQHEHTILAMTFATQMIAPLAAVR